MIKTAPDARGCPRTRERGDMLIRPYDDADYPYIKRLVERFYTEAVAEWGFTLDDEKLKAIVRPLREYSWMAEINGKVVGLLAGQVVYQHLDAKPIWQEFIWYVDPEYRSCGVRLFNFVEAWCRANGIGKMIMVYLHNSKAVKLDEFYKRMGFKPMETHFIKTL